jgi:hypothetical protein
MPQTAPNPPLRLALILRASILALPLLCAFVAANASANVFTDISYNLAVKLGITQAIAELIMSGAVLLSVGMALSLLDMDQLGIAIVLIVMIAVLIGIGWLDTWILILVALIVALMLAAKYRSPITGGG